TSDRYHDFIGFEVSKPLLERTMLKTYGLHLKDTLGPSDLAIGTFRRAVSQVIPKMVQVTLMTRRAGLVKEDRNFSKRKFLYNLSRSEYEKLWDCSDFDLRISFGLRISDFGFRRQATLATTSN